MAGLHATRGELDWALDDLETQLPALIEQHKAPDAFWEAFNAYAEDIEGDASQVDVDYVRGRLHDMLLKYGLRRTHVES